MSRPLCIASALPAPLHHLCSGKISCKVTKQLVAGMRQEPASAKLVIYVQALRAHSSEPDRFTIINLLHEA